MFSKKVFMVLSTDEKIKEVKDLLGNNQYIEFYHQEKPFTIITIHTKLGPILCRKLKKRYEHDPDVILNIYYN